MLFLGTETSSNIFHLLLKLVPLLKEQVTVLLSVYISPIYEEVKSYWPVLPLDILYKNETAQLRKRVHDVLSEKCFLVQKLLHTFRCSLYVLISSCNPLL